MSRATKLVFGNIYGNPKFRGKRVILIGGKTYPTSPRRSAGKILQRLVKKYPGKTPTIIYVPKADTLILFQ